MTILEELQAISHVRVIYEDADKIFCSVRVTVKRMEKISSGSMMFDHARYLTLGQLVVFTDKEVEHDQGGALFFKMEDAIDVVNNIADYITKEKEAPEDCILIGE
jgi:hypothetical protein